MLSAREGGRGEEKEGGGWSRGKMEEVVEEEGDQAEGGDGTYRGGGRPVDSLSMPPAQGQHHCCC
eukprot:431382-Hanusia_phi.AAC.1